MISCKILFLNIFKFATLSALIKKVYLQERLSQMYSPPYQTGKMERLAKIAENRSLL